MAYDRQSTSLRFVAGRLSILDQRALPHQEIWHSCPDSAALIDHIHSLAVRGAPLIGLAAALMLAQQALAGANQQSLLQDWQALRDSRPTAVNLMNYLDALRPRIEANGGAQDLAQAAVALFDQDQQLCLDIAHAGAPLIAAGSRILTHCNTGSLATAGIGTALGIIRHVHEQGTPLHVWVDETRPLLQGSRLTTWELAKFGIPHSLICDNMAASLMASGEVDMVLVGADRIAANGDTANKIGTYGLAVLAHYHQIPFYIAAPWTTFDLNCAEGSQIPVEQRAADEVRYAGRHDARTLLSLSDTPSRNPAFDVTPAKLISGWISDRGVFSASSQWQTSN